MEENILRLIAEAEQKAAEIKSQAQEEAAKIASDAADKAAEITKTSELLLAQMRVETLKEAEAGAQKTYETAIKACRSEAKAYADSLLEETDIHVKDIVGRITK